MARYLVDEREHRRGLVLGLTLAEVLILLLFLLLLTLGARLVKLIGRPAVIAPSTRHGLSHPSLMRFVLKLIANLSDPRDGDVSDRIITAHCPDQRLECAT